MNFFSTFTGVGGLDLGLERAGWRCAGQCEIEPYCNAVLQKHWPNVWRHSDVKTLTGELIRANCGPLDALVGGPPCQPSSVAGERRGADDDRWMWPDFLRVVSSINDAQEQPLLWLLAENPRGVLSINVEGLQFTEWLARELETCGYELLPIELAAEDVGAPHRRERIWFVGRLADAAGERRPRQSAQARQSEPAGDRDVADRKSERWAERRAESAREQRRLDAFVGRTELADRDGESQQGLPGREGAQIADPGIGREDVANPRRPQRRTAAEGRIYEPDRADSRRQEATGRPALRREGMANANGTRQHQPQGSDEESRRRTENGCREQLVDADSRDHRSLRASEELPPPLRTGWPARPGEPQHEWEEPRVTFDRRTSFSVSLLDEDRRSGRGLNGVAGQMRRAFKSALGVPTDGLSQRLAGRRRVAALKALGNAVVPQCAQILGEMINRFEEEQCFE